jgi:hypothetical protein
MALVMIMGLAATSLAVSGTAQAYPNADVDWKHGAITTGKCGVSQYSHYTGYDNGDYCNLGGTNFTKDSGGIAYKIEAYYDGTKRARIEFHPYGEHLKVCDLSNDGDSVHVALQYMAGGAWWTKTLVSPPGTSNVVDCTDVNYSFDEGVDIRLKVYDNTSKSDYMATFSGMRA